METTIMLPFETWVEFEKGTKFKTLWDVIGNLPMGTKLEHDVKIKLIGTEEGPKLLIEKV